MIILKFYRIYKSVTASKIFEKQSDYSNIELAKMEPKNAPQPLPSNSIAASSIPLNHKANPPQDKPKVSVAGGIKGPQKAAPALISHSNRSKVSWSLLSLAALSIGSLIAFLIGGPVGTPLGIIFLLLAMSLLKELCHY